jgi:NADPH:quinone reductase-like Zn-dependent oxidoreductase
MRAAVCQEYGPPEVLRIQDVERPKPGRGQLLIRVHATTVTPSDVMLRSGRFPLVFWLPARALYGFVRPRKLIPGYELAGVVEEVGQGVTRFKEGDPVFGASMWRMSCSADYVRLPETAALALKPAALSFDEAAAFADGACTALHFLRKAGVRRGQKVLVYGASGSVGTMAVQLAQHFGAEVTGVSSAANLDLVRSLGANQVIDYAAEDPYAAGEYDVVFDTVGKSSFSGSVRALKPAGTFVSTVMTVPARWRGLGVRLFTGKRVRNGMSMSTSEALRFIASLAEANRLRTIVGRRYPLAQIAEAHEHVERGHKKGNVVIVVRDD